MVLHAAAPVNEARIGKELKRAFGKLSKDVVRFRYSVEEDAVGEPAIFVRLVLRDRATQGEGLKAIGNRITRILVDDLQSDARWGLLTYVNVRSESEAAEMRDSLWD